MKLSYEWQRADNSWKFTISGNPIGLMRTYAHHTAMVPIRKIKIDGKHKSRKEIKLMLLMIGR